MKLILYISICTLDIFHCFSFYLKCTFTITLSKTGIYYISNSATPGIVIELSNISERVFKSEEMMQFVEKDICWVDHYFY